QAAEPPSGSRSPARTTARSADELTNLAGADEDIKEQVSALERAFREREDELATMLKTKDQELQEAQELLNSRYDEFNSRYEEVADALNKREDEYRSLLESKDMELVEKESELNLLRAQMEELKQQTEEMAKEMHKQLADMKIAREEAQNSAPSLPAKPAPATGFFD